MNKKFLKNVLTGVSVLCMLFGSLAFASCEKKESVNVGKEEQLENPLDTPDGFTVSADGEYTFNAVENANYYYLTIYRAEDATPDSDYLVLTKINSSSGKTSYGGNITTDIGFTDPGFYSVQVVAYPVTGSSYDHSYRAFATYGKEGTLETPKITPYKEETQTNSSGQQQLVRSGGIAYDNNYGDEAPLVIALDNKDALNGCLLRIEVFSDAAMTSSVMKEELPVTCKTADVITKTLIPKKEDVTYYVRVTALGDGKYLTPAATESATWEGTFYTLSKITY